MVLSSFGDSRVFGVWSSLTEGEQEEMIEEWSEDVAALAGKISEIRAAAPAEEE